MADEKNTIVSIAGICGGIMIPIVVLVLIFAREKAWILPPICAVIGTMGIFLAHFASKKSSNEQNK